jgi:hypothetical protein
MAHLQITEITALSFNASESSTHDAALAGLPPDGAHEYCPLLHLRGDSSSHGPLSPPQAADLPHQHDTPSRRDCTPIPEQTNLYTCDFFMPTITQIVSHMTDPAYKGTVPPEKHAVFYTNLGCLKTTMTLLAGWIRGRYLESDFYWASSAVSQDCQSTLTYPLLDLRQALLTSGYRVQEAILPHPRQRHGHQS